MQQQTYPQQVLMVAEKPSIARTIAQALYPEYLSTRAIGHDLLFFPQEFLGIPSLIKVTSVIGHVFSTDFEPQYKAKDVDLSELFDAPTLKKPSNPQSNIISHLQSCAYGCDYIVLWMDNDREGENICYEVLSVCDPLLNPTKKEQSQQYVFRARFSSITAKDIITTYQSLAAQPNFNMSLAVDTRQILDLKLGMAFSKYQSQYLQGRYNLQGKKKISYGPCQTPTLAFCVDRFDQIQGFIPGQYFKIQAQVAMKNNEISYIEGEWTKESTTNREEAELVCEEINKMQEMKIVQMNFQHEIHSKPKGLNTVEMLKIASRHYNIGPSEALHLAESLYLHGLISYPRTESTQYPKHFDFKDVLLALSRNDYLQKETQAQAELIRSTGIDKPHSGFDAGDHPPITPTAKVPYSSLSPSQQCIYELIACNFLGSLLSDGIIAKTTFWIIPNILKITSSKITQIGYRQIIPWDVFPERHVDLLGKVKINTEIVQHNRCSVIECFTKAQTYLTESELLALMEENSIGTDASMSQHIHNIIVRGYVKVSKVGRQLIPTKLGTALIHAYQEIDKELVSAKLRSSIEEQIAQVARGEITQKEVLEKQLVVFKGKFKRFVEQKEVLDKYFDGIQRFIEGDEDNKNDGEADDDETNRNENGGDVDNGDDRKKISNSDNSRSRSKWQQKQTDYYQNQNNYHYPWKFKNKYQNSHNYSQQTYSNYFKKRQFNGQSQDQQNSNGKESQGQQQQQKQNSNDDKSNNSYLSSADTIDGNSNNNNNSQDKKTQEQQKQYRKYHPKQSENRQMNTTNLKRLTGNGKNERFDSIPPNNGDNYHNNLKEFSDNGIEAINAGIEYQLNNLKITKNKKNNNKKIIERIMMKNTNNAASSSGCGDNGNLGNDDEGKERAQEMKNVLINERIMHDSNSLTHERMIELNSN